MRNLILLMVLMAGAPAGGAIGQSGMVCDTPYMETDYYVCVVDPPGGGLYQIEATGPATILHFPGEATWEEMMTGWVLLEMQQEGHVLTDIGTMRSTLISKQPFTVIWKGSELDMQVDNNPTPTIPMVVNTPAPTPAFAGGEQTEPPPQNTPDVGPPEKPVVVIERGLDSERVVEIVIEWIGQLWLLMR